MLRIVMPWYYEVADSLYFSGKQPACSVSKMVAQLQGLIDTVACKFFVLVLNVPNSLVFDKQCQLLASVTFEGAGVPQETIFGPPYMYVLC